MNCSESESVLKHLWIRADQRWMYVRRQPGIWCGTSLQEVYEWQNGGWKNIVPIVSLSETIETIVSVAWAVDIFEGRRFWEKSENMGSVSVMMKPKFLWAKVEKF